MKRRNKRDGSKREVLLDNADMRVWLWERVCVFVYLSVYQLKYSASIPI